MKKLLPLLLLFLLPPLTQAQDNTKNPTPITRQWRQVIYSQPDEWYAGNEAIAIAQNVLLYQRDTGGWPKNIPMHLPLDEKEKEDIRGDKYRKDDSTIDNNATSQEMDYLAKVYQQTGDELYKEAFLKGLHYLLEAQYENGGWPQYYPLVKGYYSHITYNDNAMLNVMKLIQKIAKGSKLYRFVSPEERKKCAASFDLGIECILKTQYRQHGVLTAWCAQHDEYTLAPAKARAYELPSLSGSESVGIVKLLRSIKDPKPEVTAAIDAAIQWFEKVKIEGIEIETFTNDEGKKDRRVVENKAAQPIWARFYDLEDNRPFFCDRDGVKRYSMAEVGYERRTGYSWYTDKPAGLLP